jgi:hypothetical protein
MSVHRKLRRKPAAVRDEQRPEKAELDAIPMSAGTTTRPSIVWHLHNNCAHDLGARNDRCDKS